MGCYINPSNQTKEEFLLDNGVEVQPNNIVWNEKTMPVCLVFNGPFTAAAVCFNKEEASHFQLPTDFRLKIWFQVDIEKLLEVSPLEHYIK